MNFTEGELYNSVFLQLKAVVYVGFIKGLGRSFYVRLKVGSSNFPDEFEPEVIKLDPSRDTETTEQGPKPGVLRDMCVSVMTDRAHQRFNVEAAMVHKWSTQSLQIVCRRFFVLRPIYVKLGTDINAESFSI